MTDEPRSHSGSRWEPAPGPGPEPAPYDGAADVFPRHEAEEGRPRPRVRALLAGAAAALALGGGLAGFAVGHGAADDEGTRSSDFSGRVPTDGGAGQSSFDGHDDRGGSDDNGLGDNGSGQPPQPGGSSSLSATSADDDPA